MSAATNRSAAASLIYPRAVGRDRLQGVDQRQNDPIRRLQTIASLCVVEEAKLRLGQPWPMKFSPDERQLRFSSLFLDELYRRRDAENGCTVSELDAKYPGVEAVWRREVDPCRRNALRLEIYDRSKYLFRWNACIERERQMIETETLAQTPVHADQSAFEMEDRFATFREVMERGSASLGFCYDKQKSRDEFPVFSKHLIGGWDLCWTLHDIDMFALPPIEGCFSPKLDLRGANLRGDSDNARDLPGDFRTS